LLFFGCKSFEGRENYHAIFLLVFLPFSIVAQTFTPIGARLNSMANASVSVSDMFSVFSNPASLTTLESSCAALFFDHRYNVSGLNTYAFAYSHDIKKSKIAAGFVKFGDQLLNQNRIELAIAHKIRMVSLGGGIGYQQLMVYENGVAKALTLQFGGNVELTPKITYGAHVYNMLRSKMDKNSQLYYPVIMKTGFSYLPNKSVIVSCEIEKDNRFDPNFKAGIEYKIIEWMFLRMGVNSNPSNGFGGLGFKLKDWKFDYGVSFHNRLGLVHFFGLNFFVNKKSKVAEPVDLKTN